MYTSRCVRKHTFCYVHRTKTHISLSIRSLVRALLSAWRNFATSAIKNTPSDCGDWSETSLGEHIQRYVTLRLILWQARRYTLYRLVNRITCTEEYIDEHRRPWSNVRVKRHSCAFTVLIWHKWPLRTLRIVLSEASGGSQGVLAPI